MAWKYNCHQPLGGNPNRYQGQCRHSNGNIRDKSTDLTEDMSNPSMELKCRRSVNLSHNVAGEVNYGQQEIWSSHVGYQQIHRDFWFQRGEDKQWIPNDWSNQNDTVYWSVSYRHSLKIYPQQTCFILLSTERESWAVVDERHNWNRIVTWRKEENYQLNCNNKISLFLLQSSIIILWWFWIYYIL